MLLNFSLITWPVTPHLYFLLDFFMQRITHFGECFKKRQDSWRIFPLRMLFTFHFWPVEVRYSAQTAASERWNRTCHLTPHFSSYFNTLVLSPWGMLYANFLGGYSRVLKNFYVVNLQFLTCWGQQHKQDTCPFVSFIFDTLVYFEACIKLSFRQNHCLLYKQLQWLYLHCPEIVVVFDKLYSLPSPPEKWLWWPLNCVNNHAPWVLPVVTFRHLGELEGVK